MNSSLSVLLKHRLPPPPLVFVLLLLLILLLFTLSTSSFVVMSLSASSSAVAPASASASRKFDLIIYGATGFTGQLAAEYVHRNYHSTGLKYALAGRNLDKLQEIRRQICGADADADDIAEQQVPIIVADAVQNPESLDALAASTRVIANYAGTPFIDKALPVVQACVKHGTCYTDITGEVPFQRASYDRYHRDAKKTGALIIHACGYDSIPSDLGAMLAANAMRERHGCDCESIELVAGDTKGGASGGTIHTGIQLIFNGNQDMPGMKESKARGVYALDPDGGDEFDDATPTNVVGTKRDTCDSVSFVSYDPISKRHVIPFIMAASNAPVVRKSNALFDYRYGKNCSYREVQAVSSWWMGFGSMLGFGVFGAIMIFPPTRWLMLKYALPQPGQGPSKELQETGYFTSHIYAVGETCDDDDDTQNKPIIEAYVKSGNAGDPGYKATARMSIEASLCMALQRDECASQEGGVLTPAFGLGMSLVDRLNKSGMELGVVSP